tara:strand:+ start:1930 stop:2688 length:759 start_codon:yes stop_codon:yes gene_type:complete
MKKIFLTLVLMSGVVYAQDTAEYKYQPETNKAEYFIGTYNQGKDLEDLVNWYNKFAKWAENQGGTFDNMSTALLTPVFHSDLNGVQVMWSNNWPTPTAQFKGMEKWFTGGGPKLVESIPTTWSEAIDAWQWVVSEPSSLESGNMMYATYADCSLEEGYTLRKVYDLYKDFAIYAQSVGDTVGRKMIVPDAGRKLPDGVDFVRLMYSSSISERGENADRYFSTLADSEAAINLTGFSCTNGRSFIGMTMSAFN